MYAQEPTLRFSHITSQNGLPYSAITRIYTACDKVVWISTLDGLIYYDGKKVKQFIIPESNSKFFGGWTNYIVEGKKNEIYVGSVKGLMVINSKSLAAYIPSLYKVKNNFESYYTEPLLEDVSNNVWLFTGFNGASLYKLSLKDTTLHLVINNINGVLSVIKNAVSQSPVGIWYRENKGAYYLSINDKAANITDSFLSGSKIKPEPSLYINDIVAVDTTEAWLATQQGLYNVNRLTKKIKLCNLGAGNGVNNVKSLAQRKNGLIYCATGKNGILVYNPFTDKVITSYRHYDQDLWSIQGNNVDHIYIDNDEHLFAAVANQGISYASLNDNAQPYYKLLTQKNEPAISFNDRITAISIKKNLNYFYVQEKGLFITNKQLIVQKIISAEYTGNINHLLSGEGDTTWAATDKGMFYIFNFGLYPVSIDKGMHTPRLYSLQATENKKMIAAGDEGVFYVETKNKALLLKKYVLVPKIDYPFFTGLFEYRQNHFLLNTKYTSFYNARIQNDTITLLTETHAINIVPLAYKNISDTGILIGCTDGLYLYNIQNAVLKKNNSGKNESYSSFLFDNNGIYGLSTNSITTFSIKKAEITPAIQPVIPGIYSPLFKTDSLKWMSGTSGGLVQFDFAKEREPFHYIFNSTDNKKNIWHSLTSISDSLVLTLQDEKKFYLSADNFTGSPVDLYFKDDGQDGWQRFSNGEMISVENLAAGWHRLSFNIFPMKEGSITKFIFIPIPWYKKWWSWLAGIIILGTLLFLFIKKILKDTQKRANIKQHITETEMAALKAQMNPHFMFNCINSIDAFIQTNDKYNATLYLNKFAKLIRNVLESSKQNVVSFSKDIETLKLYIELEELRSDNKFRTNLNIDNDLMSDDFKVPPLIIQPFVENAIIHGLKNREDNTGLLSISIQKENNSIHYVITDNGIGRLAASKIIQNKDTHFGMHMSYDRIKLFNKEVNPSVVITDLYDGLQATGTKIDFYLNIV